MISNSKYNITGENSMPEISRFQGMIIKMLFLDDVNIINRMCTYIMENM
jgi:hypothetical protein